MFEISKPMMREGGAARPSAFPRRDRLPPRAGARQFRPDENPVPTAEHLLEITHDVAQMGGFFIALLRGGLRHLFLHRGRHFADIAFEDGDGAFDPLPVLLGSDGADAGGAAVVDDALQTAFAGFGVGLRIAAGAKSEIGEQEFQGHPQRAAVRERTEILGAVVFLQPRQLQGRELFGPVEFEQQISLVVAHQDIVIGGVVFDQARFENQGFIFSPDGLIAPVFDRIDERAQLGVGPHDPGGLEIRTHAAAQIGRLADIDHFAGPVPIDVYAGLGRYFRWMKVTFPHGCSK